MQALLGAFVLVAIPGLFAAISVWRGYVLSVLWAWFAVPAFGLPALSIPFAIGLALITGMLTQHGVGPKEKEDSGEVVLKAFIHPALVLLVGWIVTKFL